MGWTQKVEPPKFDQGEIPEEDTHPAVCVGLLDLGTHKEEYQGVERDVRKLFLVWELTATDNRFVIGKDFSRSLNEKANLRKWLAAWRGKDLADGEEFDYSKLLGQGCLLQITHRTGSKDRVFALASSLVRPPKGTSIPKASRPHILWSVEDGTPYPTTDWLPSHLYGQPIKELVESCHEWKGKPIPGGNGKPAPAGGGGDADETPF